VTGMFYFMFGNLAAKGNGFDIPVTRVVIVNLDEKNPNMQLGASMMGTVDSPKANNLGDIIVGTLQNKQFADLLKVTLAADLVNARSAVDKNNADVALIIPADFSSRYFDQHSVTGQSELELYANPEKSIELAILQSILGQFMDALSGAKIAASVTANHASSLDSSVMGKVVQEYLAGISQQSFDQRTLIKVKSVTKVVDPDPMAGIVGPIMAGMMVFYAFYTGMTTAESILREDEEGTLSRLFTTPTSRTVILAGKFLAVGLTVFVQVAVLIVAAWLTFKIQWGNPISVTLIALGTVLAASSFGIFANSLIKSTKQGGVIYGGVLTVTGMLGMIKIFTLQVPNTSPMMQTVSLLVPQGWSVNGFLQSAAAASMTDTLVTVVVLLLWSIVFFSIGAWRFQRRFS
jgi:ABC-type transport system involved in multi-copper enzyme maturation permease subunit